MGGEISTVRELGPRQGSLNDAHLRETLMYRVPGAIPFLEYGGGLHIQHFEEVEQMPVGIVDADRRFSGTRVVPPREKDLSWLERVTESDKVVGRRQRGAGRAGSTTPGSKGLTLLSHLRCDT